MIDCPLNWKEKLCEIISGRELGSVIKIAVDTIMLNTKVVEPIHCCVKNIAK